MPSGFKRLPPTWTLPSLTTWSPPLPKTGVGQIALSPMPGKPTLLQPLLSTATCRPGKTLRLRKKLCYSTLFAQAVPQRSLRHEHRGRRVLQWDYRARAKARFARLPTPPPKLPGLKIEIQEKLKWDRSQVHGRQLAFSFVGKPGFQEVRGKHIAFAKPIVIGLQSVKHLT